MLAMRLRERLPELRAAIATRIYSIADPRDVADPAYLHGLDGAVGAAIDYRLAVLEGGQHKVAAVPPVLLAQARLDARDGVSLDTVLRRYVADNSLFADFLAEEAERAEVSNSALRRMLGAQASLSDHLIAVVSEEHARETANRPSNAAERRRECVKRLVVGELIDHSELGYDVEVCHLGLMAKGEGGKELMRALATRLDRRLLAIQREEEPVWGCWLGGRSSLAAEEALEALADLKSDGVFVTVSEPSEGITGFRFSHFQAKAALPIAERRGQCVLRYADVALVASIIRDDLLVASLRQLYLTPLESMRDGGQIARATLRAYFKAERNFSSTAASLGVDRHTVRNRIRAIEELLGRPLKDSATDLEIALQLDD